MFKRSRPIVAHDPDYGLELGDDVRVEFWDMGGLDRVRRATVVDKHDFEKATCGHGNVPSRCVVLRMNDDGTEHHVSAYVVGQWNGRWR